MECMTKFTRVPLAAAAVALLGFGAPAQAIKIDGKYSVTYAKETFDSERTVAGSGKFYDLAPAHKVMGTAEITATHSDSDKYTVLFRLTDMVFADALVDESLDAQQKPVEKDADGNNIVRKDVTFKKLRGGAAGDNFVLYRKEKGVSGKTDQKDLEEIKASDELVLTVTFAVTADGPGGITRTVTNTALSAVGLPASSTHEIPDAVKVVRALKETVTLSAAVVADAADNFMSFTGGTSVSPRLSESLGKLTIGVESGVLDARVESDTKPSDKVDTTMVTLIGPKLVNLGDPNDGNTGIIHTALLDDASDIAGSAVTFSGDFSFVKKLALAADCSGSLTELRKPSEDDRTVFTDMTRPRGAGAFETGQVLCVVVDGDTAIPATDAYTVTTEYKKGATDAYFPPVGGIHNLAMISRGGTTVHIPYLTTYEGYNQRLVLRNHSRREVSYTVTFTAEDGITASPASHSGMIPANSVRMTRIQEVVTLEGGSRTAATVTSDASKGMLDVATTLVNLEDRSTDTETHMPQ